MRMRGNDYSQRVAGIQRLSDQAASEVLRERDVFAAAVGSWKVEALARCGTGRT